LRRVPINHDCGAPKRKLMDRKQRKHPGKLAATSLLLALFTLSAWQAVSAQSSPLLGKLKAGPYSVGFKLINETDFSRTYKLNPQSGESARPVPISLWYPAQKTAQASALNLQAYLHLMAEPASSGKLTEAQKRESEQLFLSIPLALGYSEASLRQVLQVKTLAVKDAAAKAGKFPLLVLGQGLYFESPVTHVILCEYLASHGYVVATAPLKGSHSPFVNLDLVDLETEVRDMEFVISRARSFPYADVRRLGVIGFDLGGRRPCSCR
jgi:hypothetical protein